MQTTIRIHQATLEKLKLLKQEGNFPSYEDTLKSITHNELCKTHVYTKDGYAPIGAVVTDGDNIMVVKSIHGNKVLFDDGTYAINGGGSVWNLNILSNTVKDFNGGRVNG